MSASRLKMLYFTVEGINSFAVSYYFYYLFFYLHERFGFGNAQNLMVCAAHGLIYTVCSWHGGRFSQRTGYHRALLLGFGIMMAALLASGLLSSLIGILGCLAVWTFGVCFTWPTLEALACEGEPPERVPRMVGLYNLVWAATSALAYFVGGALKDGLGDRSIFWFPACLHVGQLALVLWARRVAPRPATAAAALEPAPHGPIEAVPAGMKLPPRAFLKLAWLANPFAYMAMNAAAPVIPELAERLHLTTREAGFYCSVWFFARLATFGWLWRWTGWHYRFRWMLGAFVIMGLCFTAMLTTSSRIVLVLTQVGFGFGVGLIYYASLYYSMDAGEAKGEHGGIHEAVIGTGVFGGAALGALGQYVVGGPSGSTWMVSACLGVGLAVLLETRRRFGARTWK